MSIRRVILGNTGVETSALGFGCASLGSRVSAADGLSALAAARERGVRWIDVAPAYGRGQAERLISGFIQAHRGELQVCTKVGLAPPRNSQGFVGTMMSHAVPVLRQAVGRLPGLRNAVRKSGIQRNLKLPLTPALLRDSLEGSLRRLGTSYVDLYALHNATAAEVVRDDVRRTLEDVVTSGLARAVAVASDEDATSAAITERNAYGAVQFAMPSVEKSGRTADDEADLITRAGGAGLGVLVHSVLGGDKARLAGRLREDTQAWSICHEASGLADPMAVINQVLVARALARNAKGVVILSMFSRQNLHSNVAVATGDEGRWHAAIAEVERLARLA